MADNVEIQGLEFQIVNDSTQAVAGLQNLINTLNRLKTATNGGTTGLSKTAQSIRELSNSLKGLNSGDASQKITRLANALTDLSRVGNVKISSSIANQLTAINTALAGLKWTDGDKLTALANGLRPLSELGKANMTTFINQLSKLPKVIEDLEAADIDKFTQQMKDLAAAMKPFADEMQKVSNGFSAFPSKIQRLVTSTDRYNGAVRKAASGTQAWGTALKGIKISTVVYASQRIGKALADIMYDASEWEGIMYRFGRAFGDAAQECYDWIKRLNDEMQINTQQFMQYSSIYGTMLKGYGVATEDAAKMAMNYTELTYDIWAGYNDIYKSFDDAAIAVRSAIAGEVEPIRKAGFTIVDSQLKITAANYGIAYSSQKASEELKSYLRYLTMVDQAKAQDLIGTYSREMTTAEGLMRTLRQQITSLSQAFGSFLLPVLAKVLPYVQAFVELIGEAIAALAALFDIEIQPVDFANSFNAGAAGAEGMADGLKDASGAAKKLKQYTAGFDELNVFDPNQGAGGGGIGAGGGGSLEGMFDIDKLWDESIFKNTQSQVDELKEKLKDILTTVMAIGTAMLEWKVANGLITLFDKMKGVSGKNLAFKLSFAITGLGLFLDGWSKIKQAIQDIKKNGVNFTNVTQLISGFAEGLSVAFLALGKVNMAGVSLFISGLSGMLSDISDMVQNGPNWENVTSLVNNLGIFLSGIGLITKNAQLAGTGLILAGVSLIVQNLGDVVEAFRTGDWSGVDKVEVAAGLLLTAGGFLVAIGKFKSILDASGGVTSITDVSTATQEIATAVGGSSGGGLNGTLKTLAQNLGWGILIITEVAGAALIITGAIALLGLELKQVGAAWQPVIDNGGTVAAAMSIGVGILGAIGVVTALLGSVGTPLIVSIALGTAILAELGVAAGLFLLEIWGIGKGLDEIGKAWQPVLDKGETIATGIGLGTSLLIGIGAVTAALGVATVASAGLLPVAIGLGTALLVELAAAFVKFTESIVDVADEIRTNLAPALSKLNPKLPKLKKDMEDFTEYMTDLADEISSYSKSMGNITWSSIVTGFQKLFNGNPIQDLADDVNGIYKDTVNLNSKLKLANPELTLAVQLMTSYVALMSKLQFLTQKGNNASTLSLDMFTNLKVVGEKLVTGFVEGINGKISLVSAKITELKTTVNTGMESMTTSMKNDWDTTLDGMNKKFSQFGGNMGLGLSAFSQTFKNGWSELWRGIRNTYVVQWNNLLDRLETGMNRAIDALNKTLRELNKLASVTGVTCRYMQKVGIQHISYMADGGFVDEGQLFIAREAGAEMVGAIGRKTAVANNDQIVEGITAGVTVANDGVIAAIYALLNAVEDKDMSISIGDDVIGRSYDRYNRSRGARVNTGAFSNAY